MSQVLTTKLGPLTTTITLVGSECVGTEIAPPSASIEKEGSEHVTPKQAALVLPENKVVKGGEEEDILAYLVQLFDHASLDDLEDSDGTIEHKPTGDESDSLLQQSSDDKSSTVKENPDSDRERQEESRGELVKAEHTATTSVSEEDVPTPKVKTRALPPEVKLSSVEGKSKTPDESSVPPTPISKGADDKYYFLSSSGWYYHDDYRNVYFEDGIVYCGGSFDFESDALFEPSFYLDDVPYWFNLEGRLLFQDLDGGFHPVQVTRRHYFRSSKQLYYFDDFYTLYSEGGALMYDGSSSQLLVDRNFPDFYIGAEPYWINLVGLWSRNADGTLHQVLKWQSDPINHNDLLAPSGNAAGSQPDQGPVPKHVESTLTRTPAANESSGTANCKNETVALEDRSLQQSLKEGPRPLMWSPSSLTPQSSPSTSTNTSNNNQPSKEPSLFQATEPKHDQAVIEGWLEDIVRLHAATESAQPGKRRGKEKHCHICGKDFRRPCALVEHIRIHTGEKPEKCPFVGCTAGFATKPNMKRHFATHRAGELEDYKPGIAPKSDLSSQSTVTRQPTGATSGRAARNSTAPYNSKHSNVHQTFGFRIPF